jgi:hypothetical protein
MKGHCNDTHIRVITHHALALAKAGRQMGIRSVQTRHKHRTGELRDATLLWERCALVPAASTKFTTPHADSMRTRRKEVMNERNKEKANETRPSTRFEKAPQLGRLAAQGPDKDKLKKIGGAALKADGKK